MNQSAKRYGIKPRSLIGVGGHFVKSIVIDNILNNENMKSLYQRTCLMIDGGQAGDVPKYYNIGIRSIYLTDPFEDQLIRGRKFMFKIKNDISGLTIKLFKIAFTDASYVEQAFKDYNYYDIIDWQFAIHYTWTRRKSDDIAKKILALMSGSDNYSKEDSRSNKLVISCFDGDKLFESMNGGKLRFKISEDSEFVFSPVDDNTYQFSGGESPHDESYVFLIDLIKSLDMVGIKLIYKQYFSEIIQEYIDKPPENTRNQKAVVFQRSIEELRSSRDSGDNLVRYNEMIRYYNYMVALVFMKE